MDLTGGLVYAIGNRVIPEKLEKPTQSWGIRVREAIGAQVVGNSIEGGGAGIFLDAGAFHSSTRGNVVSRATVGLFAAEFSEENLVALNSFVDNFEQAVDLGTSNRWDDGTSGNYWSDMTGADANGDGVWDNPRSVSGGARDRFPLVTPGKDAT
jgi:nitrous oxidase accessory protein NosD